MSRDNASKGSSRSPSQIESDLAGNRQRIAHTLDHLESQFTPGRVLDQAMQYTRRKRADGTTSRLQDTVVNNPLPILLIGAGLAWLALSGSQGSVPSRARDDHASEHGHDRDTGRPAAPTERMHTGDTPPPAPSARSRTPVTATPPKAGDASNKMPSGQS